MNEELINENDDSNEIPEELFIEKSQMVESGNKVVNREFKNVKKMQQEEAKANETDLKFLFIFLEKNMQDEGYEDALSNPDMTVMEQKINLIRSQIKIKISMVKSHYNKLVRELNFHIESRSRNGLIDIVEELRAKLANVEEEFQKVKEIEEDSLKNNGLSETLVTSYVIGFRNGYSAISNSLLL